MATFSEWFENIKKGEIFNQPTSWFLQIVGFFIFGVVAGFLIKHFGRYVFWLIIVGGLSLWFLHYFHFISINYAEIKAIVGLSPDTTISDITAVAGAWMRTHISECIAAAVGLFISWTFM